MLELGGQLGDSMGSFGTCCLSNRACMSTMWDLHMGTLIAHPARTVFACVCVWLLVQLAAVPLLTAGLQQANRTASQLPQPSPPFSPSSSRSHAHARPKPRGCHTGRRRRRMLLLAAQTCRLPLLLGVAVMGHGSA
jgi:hypothetical protein